MTRIETILDAAAELIAEVGPERLAMNEVARRAGISPGSLYQFFTDKPALLESLVQRYGDALNAILHPEPAKAKIREIELAALIDSVISPVLAFVLATPGFRVLFEQNAASPLLKPALEPIHDSIVQRLSILIVARSPGMDPVDSRRIAQMCELIVRAVAPLIVEAQAADRHTLVAELTTVLVRYLEPYDRPELPE